MVLFPLVRGSQSSFVEVKDAEFSRKEIEQNMEREEKPVCRHHSQGKKRLQGSRRQPDCHKALARPASGSLEWHGERAGAMVNRALGTQGLGTLAQCCGGRQRGGNQLSDGIARASAILWVEDDRLERWLSG